MAKSKVESEKVDLPATRRAVGRIRDAAIREDVMRFVSGAEVCLEHREVYLAFDAVKTIVTTVVALDRTISPEVATGVLDGLVEDSAGQAIALRRGLGFTKNENQKCDIQPGTGPGTSVCVAKRRSTCYTLDSGSGCGGTSGFRHVWDLARQVG